jgi:hypothetical protein
MLLAEPSALVWTNGLIDHSVTYRPEGVTFAPPPDRPSGAVFFVEVQVVPCAVRTSARAFASGRPIGPARVRRPTCNGHRLWSRGEGAQTAWTSRRMVTDAPGRARSGRGRSRPRGTHSTPRNRQKTSTAISGYLVVKDAASPGGDHLWLILAG